MNTHPNANTTRTRHLHDRLGAVLRRRFLPTRPDDRGSLMTEYPVVTAIVVAAGITALGIIATGVESTANYIVGLLPG